MALSISRFDRLGVLGSNRWRADHQIGSVCSEHFGTTFLASDFSGRMIRFDSSDGARLQLWNPEIGQLNCVTTNGQSAMCGGVQEIAIIDLDKDRPPVLVPVSDAVIEIQFGNQGEFYFYDASGNLFVGNDDGSPLRRISLADDNAVLTFAWDSAGQQLYAASFDQIHAVTDQGRTTKLWRNHPGQIRAVAPIAKNQMLVASDDGLSVCGEGSSRVVYENHEFGPIEELSVCPRSGIVAARHKQQAVLLDPNSWKILNLSPSALWTTSLDFIDAGVAIIGAAPQQLIPLQGPDVSEQRPINSGHQSWVNGVGQLDSGFSVTVSRTGQLQIHDLKGKRLKRHSWEDWSRANMAGVSASGTIIISLHRRGQAAIESIVYDPEDNSLERKQLLSARSLEESIVDGDRVAVVADEKLVVFELGDSERLLQIPFPLDRVGSLCLASNRVIATGLQHGVVEFNWVKVQATNYATDLPRVYFYHCAYSPHLDATFIADIDNSRIVSASGGKLATIVQDDVLRRITCMTVHNRHAIVIVGTMCGQIIAVDVESGEVLARQSIASHVHSIQSRDDEIMVGLGDCTAVKYRIEIAKR